MYYNHNLRANLQEWKNRLVKSSHEQFGQQLKYFLGNVENNKIIKGILLEACANNQYTTERLERIEEELEQGNKISFKDSADHAAYCISFLKYYTGKHQSFNLYESSIFYGNSFREGQQTAIEELITPLVYFIHDSLDRSNSTIYLLEKYKRRTEWFTRSALLNSYTNAIKNFEQIFEDDLRMFLFDQGIDYPFSTPKSTSGRSDIVGAIDTSDPIIIEIKVLDKSKGYGKKRIIDGFTQIYKYANDFNKDFGYLVIFNLDDAELKILLNEKSSLFPPMLSFNNKSFFFIIVNLIYVDSASKQGKLGVIEIGENDLTSSLESQV
jgi:hypothetical protein